MNFTPGYSKCILCLKELSITICYMYILFININIHFSCFHDKILIYLLVFLLFFFWGGGVNILSENIFNKCFFYMQDYSVLCNNGYVSGFTQLREAFV